LSTLGINGNPLGNIPNSTINANSHKARGKISERKKA
jgi:hypothetical protein